jgi:hypothetical protein
MRPPALLIIFSALVMMGLFSVVMLSFSENGLAHFQPQKQQLPRLLRQTSAQRSSRAAAT